MAIDREQRVREALKLNSRDHAELPTLLIDNLASGTKSGVEEAWMHEIDRNRA